MLGTTTVMRYGSMVRTTIMMQINVGNNHNDVDQWWEQPYIMMLIIYMGNVGCVLQQELVELGSHLMDGRMDGWMEWW
jgi:hypothetical protein